MTDRSALGRSEEDDFNDVADLALVIAQSMCGPQDISAHELGRLRRSRGTTFSPGEQGLMILLIGAGDAIAFSHDYAMSSDRDIPRSVAELYEFLEAQLVCLLEGQDVQSSRAIDASQIPSSAVESIQIASDSLNTLRDMRRRRTSG